MADALLAPAAIGTEAYVGALGLAGATQATAQLVTLPMTLPGRGADYAKPTNTAFTLGEICAGLGCFVSTLSTATVWTLPTLYQLGWTWAFGKNLVIPVQRQGLGAVFLNPAICRGTVATQAAMLGVLGATTGDYVLRSDLANQVFLLTGTVVSGGQQASTLANWTALPTGPANLPTAAGIVIHDPDGLAPSNLTQWQTTLLKLVGPDEWCYV